MEELGGRKRIDRFAKEGHLKEGDVPGDDLFNDGTNELGERIAPSSTVTQSGGIYHEDVGPNDMVRRDRDEEIRTRVDGLDVVRNPQAQSRVVDRNDAKHTKDHDAVVEKWLQENDPEYKKAA